MTTHTDSLAPRAAELAAELLSGVPSRSPWKHSDLTLATTALVRSHGAAGALDLLRAHAPQHHETLAAFSVWAIDRLMSAGLSTMAVLWHPLMEVSSPLSWWTIEDLRSDEARLGWIAPTSGTDAEPRPTYLGTPQLIAA